MVNFTYKSTNPQSSHTIHYSSHAFLAVKSAVLVDSQQQLYGMTENLLVGLQLAGGILPAVGGTQAAGARREGGLQPHQAALALACILRQASQTFSEDENESLKFEQNNKVVI